MPSAYKWVNFILDKSIPLSLDVLQLFSMIFLIEDFRLMVYTDVSKMGVPDKLRYYTFLQNGDINNVLTPNSVSPKQFEISSSLMLISLGELDRNIRNGSVNCMFLRFTQHSYSLDFYIIIDIY